MFSRELIGDESFSPLRSVSFSLLNILWSVVCVVLLLPLLGLTLCLCSDPLVLLSLLWQTELWCCGFGLKNQPDTTLRVSGLHHLLSYFLLWKTASAILSCFALSFVVIGVRQLYTCFDHVSCRIEVLFFSIPVQDVGGQLCCLIVCCLLSIGCCCLFTQYQTNFAVETFEEIYAASSVILVPEAQGNCVVKKHDGMRGGYEKIE